MADFLLRPPTEADIPEILDCWQRSFGDPPALIRALLDAGELLTCAMAAEQGGLVRSVMFAIDGLSIDGVPSAYLYALCTHPDFRAQGMGQAVLRSLASVCFDCGAELVFLSPADPSLAAWYRSMGMQTVQHSAPPPCPVVPQRTPALAPVSAEDYAALRRSPIRVPLRLLRAQELLCRELGGGFFRLELDGACAAVCAQPDDSPRAFQLRELSCPPCPSFPYPRCGCCRV